MSYSGNSFADFEDNRREELFKEEEKKRMKERSILRKAGQGIKKMDAALLKQRIKERKKSPLAAVFRPLFRPLRSKSIANKSRQTQLLKLRIKLQQLRNQNLAQRGLLGPAQSVLSQQMPMPKPQIYPAYATQEVVSDLDDTFNADISHADGNIFGYENYYDESFYNEQYFHDEWKLTPLQHLSINVNPGVSPLLW